MALYNLAGFKTATLGVADVVFSAPITALNTFPLAGVPNGATVTYMLENFDGGGNVDAREVGRGTWNSGTLTLARTTVVDSTNGGAKIVLGGNAEARITAIAQDFSAAAVGAPALVTPSVAGNFVSFSNTTGGQADSGVSAASFQPIDATLTSIAALGTAANKMIYTTGVDTWAEADLTAFARTFLDDANAAAVRTTIGAGTGSGDLLSTNNLSDLTNAATARTNLGLGAAALLAVPITAANGGTGIANGASATLTLPNLAIALGGGGAAQTYTLPAAGGTFALLNAANIFTAVQTITLAVDANTAWQVNTAAGVEVAKVDSRAPITGNPALKVTSLGGELIRLIYDATKYFRIFIDGSQTTAEFFHSTGTINGGFGTQSSTVSFFSISAHPIVFKTTNIERMRLLSTGEFGVGTNAAATKLHVRDSTTTTNAVREVQRLEAIVSTASTGSANGFGTGLSWYAETATDTTNQQQGLISTSWIDATNASRKAKMSLSAYDTVARLGIEIEASGSAAKLGFFGATTVVKPIGTTDLRQALIDLGLYTTGGASPLDLNGGALKVGAITNDAGLAHGTYTPTRSAEANLDANVTMTEAQYMRVGNTVTVSGRFTADPTLPATTTSFEITLPVASNIGAVEDAAGTAFCGNIAAQGAEVTGSVANNTAVITWKSGDTTSQSWSYIFTYQII